MSFFHAVAHRMAAVIAQGAGVETMGSRRVFGTGAMNIEDDTKGFVGF